MNLSSKGITLTSDESIFIPAIYISDQNTNVKLEEFIIYDITFQPQIAYSTDQLGGSALKIQNFTDTPPIIPPLILPLSHPKPDTSINKIINSTSFKDIQSSRDISNRGCAAVYEDIGDNGSLIIEDTSYTFCSYIVKDGGSIYAILYKTFRFKTKKTVTITRCRSSKDTLEVI
ncbi:MAG: hypothetical protein EZS28_034522 [Streblomastix strix]|uniref:Uncharacterized protein n=1 Tax=Streblomastix strix TaxID=222440 RepID=A0A5J4UIT1_9EUKA|nr:MAG: hypothetical protein EZS28_034522 [Streblomastix strix]